MQESKTIAQIQLCFIFTVQANKEHALVYFYSILIW